MVLSKLYTGLLVLRGYSDVDTQVTASNNVVYVGATRHKISAGDAKYLRSRGWYQPEAENENIYDPDCDWAITL